MKTHSLLAALIFLFSVGLGTNHARAQDAQTLVNEALESFEKKKYDETLKKLQEAEKLDPNSPFILNLLGATLTKKKDYDGAEAYFNKAIGLDSSFFPAQFNLGEIAFLRKDYPAALSHFSNMLKNYQGNELLQFKVILALLLTDQMETAERQMKRMIFPGQEPAWYYAHAAIAFKKGEKGQAKKDVRIAQALYGEKTAIYQETFTDLGWPIK